jgi:hypothetical protein
VMEFDLARGHRIRARRGHATHPCVRLLADRARPAQPALLNFRKRWSPDKMQMRPSNFIFSRFFASSDQQMSQARLLERGGAGQRECGTRWRGAARVWNSVARGNASVERGGAGQRECGTFGCSRDVWFTRAQARAYAACGGGGRKRPRRRRTVVPNRLAAQIAQMRPRELMNLAARQFSVWVSPVLVRIGHWSI